YRGNMALFFSGLIFRPGPRGYAARTAVIADPVDGRVVDDGGVVDVVDVGDIHVVYGAIVEKASVLPASAFVAFTEVSEAIDDPTIETDAGTPIAFMKDVSVAAPTPPGRSPKQSRFRCEHPRARHPIISIIAVSPVSGRPDVALSGTRRLFIDRQRPAGHR